MTRPKSTAARTPEDSNDYDEVARRLRTMKDQRERGNAIGRVLLTMARRTRAAFVKDRRPDKLSTHNKVDLSALVDSGLEALRRILKVGDYRFEWEIEGHHLSQVHRKMRRRYLDLLKTERNPNRVLSEADKVRSGKQPRSADAGAVDDRHPIRVRKRRQPLTEVEARESSRRETDRLHRLVGELEALDRIAAIAIRCRFLELDERKRTYAQVREEVNRRLELDLGQKQIILAIKRGQEWIRRRGIDPTE